MFTGKFISLIDRQSVVVSRLEFSGFGISWVPDRGESESFFGKWSESNPHRLSFFDGTYAQVQKLVLKSGERFGFDRNASGIPVNIQRV